MTEWLKKYWIILLMLAFVIGWSILFYFFSPELVVDKIGVKNSYLVAFMIGVIAGVSTITGTSFYATIVTLSSGGVSPLILGIVGGLGLFVSDTIFYFIVDKGADIVSQYKKKWFEKIESWITNVHPAYVYLGILIYTSLPLPNDVLLIALAISSYSYKKFAIFMLAGTLILTISLSYLAY